MAPAPPTPTARRLLTLPAAALLGTGAVLATGAVSSGAQSDAGNHGTGTREVIEVRDSTGLKDALARVAPGDTIRLADGTYTGNFKTTRAGDKGSPITLTGSAGAILTAGGGYGLHLNGAGHWNLKGFTVTGGQKGIVMDGADGVHIDGVTVRDLDMEAVHWRKSSSDGSIRNSTIRDTGKNGRGMGEGVYVGSAGGTSRTKSGGGTDDRSDRILIEKNVIGPGVGGENIDIKEGTTGARVIGNTFDGEGLTGANYDDSWVDIKGNGVLVENNTGRNTTNNGFETHEQQDGWGCGTVFRGNESDLTGASGRNQFAINVTNYDADTCPVTVSGDNTVKGGKGLTNPGIPVG
ncbi:right-handed parallel beta-helix repeat-containing protein [Streptomyces iconiensis]|uniref:Sheath polysaccharide-degrading enzyme n=1 Tax=Streptomyces iconiensis TaxID=1384038 RepID=A0ABT6ZWH3_9ACTN|nr:right-handed parallel beta-helix repeat-containing protein [Streptomyces iconiensis]MDJ1133182.1 sheath polysaccharide-degrading enzyme [Streptomyces iconiensis]